MARRGARVLVAERERKFRDRVRGEGMHPWGVGEARALDIERPLETCGHRVRWRNAYAGGALVLRRDLVATTPGGHTALDFYHPDAQAELLAGAEDAGADVRRGVEVTGVTPGARPEVELSDEEGRCRVRARLVVGADGRTSRVRAWAGLPARRDPDELVMAGVLHGGLALPEDAIHMVYNIERGQAVLIFPLGDGRFRSYFFYRRQGPPRPLAGARHAQDFVAACVETGASADWFARAEVLGPLAAFEGADRWVEHPHRDGVVLIGDAAAASDPCFGCGLSLTLRDARVLRDALVASDDWPAAADAYAAAHDGYYGALHRLERWTRELLWERGPDADARRAHVLPLLEQEPDRRPDYAGFGPDWPSDEAARRRFFGEDRR
jgi:2-polyprenyl-6-methoxyphenol hydroxylase-like FAD-dependent oxidoreductase